MDKSDPSKRGYLGLFNWNKGEDHKQLCKKMEERITIRFEMGESALKRGDYILAHECISILELKSKAVSKHISLAPRRLQELKEKTFDGFVSLCKELQQILESGSRTKFQGYFHDYCNFVMYVPCIMESSSGKKAYNLTNQLVYEALKGDIIELEKLINSFNFVKVKLKVEHLRVFGGFVADKCSFLYTGVTDCCHINKNKWLESLRQICLETFISIGYDSNLLKHYTRLDILPSASCEEVNKAFRKKSLLYHPDKSSTGDGTSDIFLQIKESRDILLARGNQSRQSQIKPFDSLLKGICSLLRDKVREYWLEQRYESIETILFQLGNLHLLDDLVHPSLDSHDTCTTILTFLKNQVEGVKTKIDSNWSERKYRTLNDNIIDIKLMEDKFKGYPDIFPSSWNDGIIQKVEEEIKSLGHQAQHYIKDRNAAKQHFDDFRKCFIAMGCVLVELPSFKDFTRSIMYTVLESCLISDWGYSYLFELGLKLQRGDDNDNEEERRVAQTIVAEFSQFKEIMTMVWNEETSQKPVEDTVCGIRGHDCSDSNSKPLNIDKDKLIDSFRAFEAKYAALIGEYIDPDADLDILIKNTTAAADKLKPLSLQNGWNSNVRHVIPNILAGIFSLFTILKSGASYNRLVENAENTQLGQKLLMKPHNIQVLTLLRLFGCDSSSNAGLDSQLLQIRTGEGKSMILGAASVALALLGFRVRCVCYSEYLSSRDYGFFQDVFKSFKLTKFIKYSKITALSEDNIAEKGNIRNLTECLLRGNFEGGVDAKATNLSCTMTDTQSQDTQSLYSNINAQGFTDDTLLAHSSKHEYHNIASKCSTDTTISDKKKSKCTVGETLDVSQISNINLDSNNNITSFKREEILLVDEVDVFFGHEFYGQTYNQVVKIREPEISKILQHIWSIHKFGNKKLRLTDIKKMSAYSQLQQKLSGYEFLLDNEILLMLDQVKHVDEDPHYYLDGETDRIGYRVMDTISFDVTFGYRTIFAYLKEAEEGNLNNRDETLSLVLGIPVSCGQFSYANISPARILGVSGTLEAMGKYEMEVLAKYGVNKFVYIPSVYGKSNFQFDKAGSGLCIDASLSDHFYSIIDETKKVIENQRAVIIFFHDKTRLKKFTDSPFYSKLGRQKRFLTEEMNVEDKDFVIKKAATSGQVTLCTAVFGRGTDFFCKDDRVQNNGGVHVIQTFFSTECSEEVQIQGRTARQGKKGSYQLLLLESDLEEQFGIPCGKKDQHSINELYDWLCDVRTKHQGAKYQLIETNLIQATEMDQVTHKYFDFLLSKNPYAKELFQELYLTIKKPPVPSEIVIDLAFAIDITGSMHPFVNSATNLIKGLVDGSSPLVSNLQSKFTETVFKLRLAPLGFRDIDDGEKQFQDNDWGGGNHFTENIPDFVTFLDSLIADVSGGGDLAEDLFGAINHCTTWNAPGDWASSIKIIMVLTDAPAHGLVPHSLSVNAQYDSYPVRHPLGLTAETIVDNLIANNIDLFLCSYNPAVTLSTELKISDLYNNHPDNTENREIMRLPMVVKQNNQDTNLIREYNRHIIFVLDESGSMAHSWAGVVVAYNQYMITARKRQHEADFVSVVQFATTSRVTVEKQLIAQAPSSLSFRGGGTRFTPPANDASRLACKTPPTHVPVIIFMSDGGSNDSERASQIFTKMNADIHNTWNEDIELHVIAFGSGANRSHLQSIASASPKGRMLESASCIELSKIFVDIAGSQHVVNTFESEICKRVSDAVSDKLSIEYFD